MRGRSRLNAAASGCVRLALAPPAEDDVQPRVRERRERAQRRGDVRRLGVVDVAHAAELANQLDPMRDAREGRERVGDRVVGDACGTRRGRRRRGVLAVVAPGDARLGGERVVGGELDTPRRARHVAEPARHDGDVVAGLPLEDPELRVRVALERAVAVEVVGLEVQQDGDLGVAACGRPRAGTTRARRRSTRRARPCRRAT